MNLYTGNWIIVIRKVRDTTSRGKVIDMGMSERWAKERAKELAKEEKFAEFNVWAMDRRSF